MTFDEFCERWNVTPGERAELCAYLVALSVYRLMAMGVLRDEAGQVK